MRTFIHISLYILLTALPCTQGIAQTYNIVELYELAYDNDSVFRAEQSKHAATLLNPKIARGELLPQLSFNLSHTRVAKLDLEGRFFGGNQGANNQGSNNQSSNSQGSDERYSYDVGSYGFSLTQTLFDAEKIARFKQSKSTAWKSQLELESAHQELILRLATVYFDTLTAESHLAFAQAEKEAVAKQLQQAQKRFEVGLTPITDAKEAQAAYDLSVANEIAARNQLENSFHRLEAIINRRVQQLPSLQERIDINTPEPDNPETWIEQALSSNLNILATKIAANIAREEIDIQQADHYPTLELFAQQNINDTRGGPSPLESENVSLGINMNMPLFSGGTTYYKSKQAAQQHRESLEMLEETQREVRRATREAYLNISSDVSRIKALQHALESAQAAVDANRAGFNVGTRTSAEVLIALRDLFRTQQDYAETRHNYILNTLRLKQLVGNLSKTDIMKINYWLNSAR